MTGASGKIGKSFVDAAMRAGHSLLCLGRRLPPELEGAVDYQYLDFAAPADNVAVSEALRSVDTAVHLAAKVDTAPVDSSAALAMYQINVLGTLHFIQCLAKADVKHLVLASAANFYDSRLSIADERSLIRPVSRTLYLSSKAAQEAIARECCLNDGIRCATMRISSVVGATADGLISRLVGKVMRGEAITIHSPSFGADFVTADSVVRGLMTAATQGLEGEFNLSSGTRHTLTDIIALIEARLGCVANIQYSEPTIPPDQGFPAISCDLLRGMGYEPDPLEMLIDALAQKIERASAAWKPVR
ncbi:NAD-dependent epimerase/dehydratase family protein [Erythrobacter sp. R86502]|uniref:NAD-dependent epimerase/dehydratase family protein n=1 Tax=Erythrobacter sp. R86502 TaxID=3093846 RepID=UPI0036D425FE